MSAMEGIDDSLLEADDDELDYDLEQDEEEALLADPDNFDENEGNVDLSAEEIQYGEPEANEEDILDIDASVRLDEVEEDAQDNSVQNSANALEDDDDETKDQKERNRFCSERVQTQNVNRPVSNVIPDSLDKVNVNVQHNVPNNRNNMPRNNGRFQRGGRGRGRGRGRGLPNNFHRPSVFDRVGHNSMEGKTVHINPHFRGNVQANENARLVWDHQTAEAINPPRFNPGPQLAQIAPFQSQSHPWANQQFPEQSHNTFNQPPVHQQTFQESQSHLAPFNQPQEVVNQGMRPLLNNPPPPLFSHPPQMAQNSAGFRGREVRFNQHQSNNQVVAMNPSNTFHQQGGAPFQGRNNFNQRQPFVNQTPQQNLQQPPHFLSSNQHNQQFEPAPQPFINQNQYPPNQPSFPNPTFHPPTPNFPPQQTFNQPQVFESYDAQNNQYNTPNQFQPPSNQFQITVPNNVTNNYHPEHFNNQPIQIDNFTQNQNQSQNFNNTNHAQQYNNNNRNQYINRGHHNQLRQNRHHNFNPNNRSPPKRRQFENKSLAGGNDRDLPKKKKRSMELSNLHEVPTVDIPDTTTQDKVEEEDEDEETKAYRKQIEAQKQLREKMLHEKELRRKLAAAQIAQSNSSGSTEGIQNKTNLTTIPTTKAPLKIITQVVQNKIPHQVQAQKRMQQKGQLLEQVQNQEPKQQFQQQQQQIQRQQAGRALQRRTVQQQQQLRQQQQQKQQQQQRQQQGAVKRIIPNNNQQPLNNTSAIQRRVNNQTQPIILITQKNTQQVQKQVPQQSQRIVMTQQNNQTNTAALNRIVLLKGVNNATVVANDTTDSAIANKRPFLSNRKVISNNVDNKVNLAQGLIDSPVVVVSNLAAGMTDIKIRKLCQGLGPVQNIQMISNNRQATIRFKNIVSAHKFFKKYQRKIIDLSMIQVTLGEPS